MPERRLAILACARLAAELEQVARGFDPAEVAFISYPARCGRPPLTWDELVQLIPEALGVDRVELFAGCCLEGLGEPPRAAAPFRVTRFTHCLSPLAGDFAVGRYQEQGLYLVTSGWLGQWRERLAEQGLVGETAAELFGESAAGLLHLDTGVLPEADRELSAFASQVGLPHQTVPLGLEQLALRCERLVLAWRAERREAAAVERLELARRRNADYAMVLDLLKLIVQTTGKETVLGEILQLYQMMFAAGEVAWIPVSDGAAGEVVRTGPGDPARDNRLKAAALALEAPSQLLPSGAGFLLRVEWEGRALGVICVDRIALPDHLEQYLQVARETVVVCAVVLNNALNLESLIALSHRLMLNEEALKESEQTYHDLFQKSSAIQLLIDPATGEIMAANDAAVAFYGFPSATLTSLRIDQINDLPQARVREELARAAAGVENHFLFRHRLADGELRNVEVYSTAIRVRGRTLLHTILHDITERVRSEETRRDLEKRLQLAHKAQSLGRMAAAIAHKYNNLLGAVLGNLELALLSIPPGTPPADNLGEALKAASRAAEVSTLMLTYLGQAPGRHEKLDLAELCRHSAAALQNGLPPEVALILEMEGAPAWVSGNEQQLQQLLASLVTNGWEALAGGGGEVRLRLKSVDAALIETANRFPLDWEPEKGIRFCVLEIADQGCGISEADIGELFDPFFSKKFTGRGLGLPIVLGVVRTHRGAVTVESEPGKGSTFRVYLPQLEYVPESKGEEQAQALAGGTVLLVEDEPAVRKTTSAMLGISGFTVLEARDGAEALELYRQHQGAICLVVSDLTMPGLDGWSTLAALRNLDPDLPAILTSGYDQSQVMCGDHLQWPQVFLRKPYTMGTLREAIRQALTHQG